MQCSFRAGQEDIKFKMVLMLMHKYSYATKEERQDSENAKIHR
jgi:hypothetical protein